MISKEKKKQIIKDLLEQIKKAKAIYFANFSGLKVPEMNELRQELKKDNAVAKVAKKNLVDIALTQAGYKDKVSCDQNGSLMLNFAFEDSLKVAKTLWNFSKKNDKFQILGGMTEEVILDSEEVIKLAKISSQDVLFGRLVGSIAYPIQQLLYTLNGNVQKLVVVLGSVKAIRQLAETI